MGGNGKVFQRCGTLLVEVELKAMSLKLMDELNALCDLLTVQANLS